MTQPRSPDPAANATDRRCDHGGVLMIHRIVGGSVARCLGCQAIEGPPGRTRWPRARRS